MREIQFNQSHIWRNLKACRLSEATIHICSTGQIFGKSPANHPSRNVCFFSKLVSFGSVWDLFLVHSIFLLCARVPFFCYLLRYSLMYDFMQPLKFCREKSKKYIYKKPENIEISFSLCLCIINLEIYLKTLLSLTQTPNRDINPRVL